MAEGGRNDGVIPSGSEGSSRTASWLTGHEYFTRDPSLPLGMTCFSPPSAIRPPPSAVLRPPSYGLTESRHQAQQSILGRLRLRHFADDPARSEHEDALRQR